MDCTEYTQTGPSQTTREASVERKGESNATGRCTKITPSLILGMGEHMISRDKTSLIYIWTSLV